jgi:hypothetical protein
MASDFLSILNRLHDSRADFVIVGGVAAALHGGSRVTFDLDIVPRLEEAPWQAAVDLLWNLLWFNHSFSNSLRPILPRSASLHSC